MNKSKNTNRNISFVQFIFYVQLVLTFCYHYVKSFVKGCFLRKFLK